MQRSHGNLLQNAVRVTYKSLFFLSSDFNGGLSFQLVSLLFSKNLAVLKFSNKSPD